MKNLSVKLLSGTATMATVSLMAINPAAADTVSGSVTFTSAGEAISAYAVEVDSPGSRFNSAEISLGYRPLNTPQLFNTGQTLFPPGILPSTLPGLALPGNTGVGTLGSFLALNNLTLVGGAPKIQEVLAELNDVNGTGVNLDTIQWTLATANSICAGDLASLEPAEDPICFEVEAVAPLTVTDEGFVAANVELTGSFDPTVILSDFLKYAEFIFQDVNNSPVYQLSLNAADVAPYIDGILQYAIQQTIQGGGSLEQVIATVYNNPSLTTDTKNAIFQALAEGGYLDNLSSVAGDVDDIQTLLGFDISDVEVAAGILAVP
ncbi:hypothetical protein AWQ21_10135 [Picosynechococcus sp. PCC 7003]|nr:hypothetical protein AWQ21_10135 [Picosynechococcus sp. PCC 7003]